MHKYMKVLIFIIVALYWVMPDIAPGPIDDLIVLIIGAIVNKKFVAVEQ